MKIKYSVLTIVFILLTMSLATLSYASTNFYVDNIDATITDTDVLVEWSNTKDADGYEVYVELPAIGYQHIGDIASNKVQIIGFKKGEMYAIKVRAYKENGNTRKVSDYSSEVIFKFGESSNVTSQIGEIKNIKAVSLGTTGKVEWDKVSNADGYAIYAGVGNSNLVRLGQTDDNKVDLINMKKEYVYTLKIKPFIEKNGETIYGSFSDLAILKYEEKVVPQKPDTVQNLKVQMNGDVANLTWNKVENVDGYEVCIEVPGNGKRAYYNVDVNEISLRNFTEGYTYKATVRAYIYVNGEKIFGESSQTKNIKYEKKIELDKVTGLNVTMNGDKATFKWNSVKDAEGYEIVVNMPGIGEQKYISKSTTRDVTGIISKDTLYSVKVRAYADDGKICGEYSDTKYFKNNQKIEVGKVTGLKVQMDEDKAIFKWNRVSGADGYQLVIYKPGRGIDTYTVYTTSRSMTGFTNKDSYYNVKVRAFVNDNGIVYGEYSDVEYFKNEEKIELNRVTGLKVTMDEDEATFKWNSVRDADGYEIVVNIPGLGDQKYTSKSTTKTLDEFTETKYNYTVKVRAYADDNGKKVYGDYSSTVNFKYEKKEPDKVLGLTVIRVGQGATFKWNKVSEADGYEMVIDMPGIGERKYTQTTTTAYKTGFTYTQYKYTIKVRAYVNDNGKKIYGEYSNLVKF